MPPRKSNRRQRRPQTIHPRTQAPRELRSGILFGGGFAFMGLIVIILGAVRPYLYYLNNERFPDDYSSVQGITVLFIGGLFMFFGIVVIVALFRDDQDNFLPQGNVRQSTLPEYSADTPTNSTQTLETASIAKQKFFILLAFSIIWNAVTWIGVFQGFSLFMLFFAAIGLASLGSAIWQGLALLNPKVTLTLHNLPLRPGSRASVNWHIEGQTKRLNDFSISVIGQEKATYRHGTDTKTDTHDFYEHRQSIPIIEVHNGSGVLTITIPEKTMHTWDSLNNKIVWLLRVHGDIPNWPDIKEDYKMTVYPKQ